MSQLHLFIPALKYLIIAFFVFRGEPDLADVTVQYVQGLIK